MITFKYIGIGGRLGNVLFQAAATISTAARYETDYRLRPIEYLKQLNIQPNKLTVIGNYTELFWQKEYTFSIIPYNGGTLNLNGLFQSEKYFKDYEAEIRALFQPRFVVPGLSDYTSIHVRRCDYVTHYNHVFATVSTDYYERALAELDAKKVMVFSDDIAWCKEHFKGSQYEFSEGKSDVKDLFLMASCKDNVIANSTFSWWGAWLNNNPNKRIIAPQQWYTGEWAIKRPTIDLIPEGWKQIDN